LDPTGLINNIYDAAAKIDFGRKGIAIRGMAEEGRISYEDGISKAMHSFRDAASTADPETIILAEFTFISQEYYPILKPLFLQSLPLYLKNIIFVMKPIKTLKTVLIKPFKVLMMHSLLLKP